MSLQLPIPISQNIPVSRQVLAPLLKNLRVELHNEERNVYDQHVKRLVTPYSNVTPAGLRDTHHISVFNAPLCGSPQPVTLYGSSMLGGSAPTGQALEVEGASQPGLVTKNGLVLYGTDGKPVSVRTTIQSKQKYCRYSWLYGCWVCLNTACLPHSCW